MKKIKWIAFAIMAIIILLCCVSCKTTKYVEKEIVRIDTIYKNNVSVDSFYVHDSVYVEKMMKNDTMFLIKYKYAYRDRVSIKNDTVYKINIKTDSIYIDKPVVKTKTDYKGWIAFMVLLLCVGLYLYRKWFAK